MKWPEELMFMKNSRAEQKTSDISMEGKLCVVSGASSGVGLVTIHRFAKYGANIVMVVRNKEKSLPIKKELEEKYNVSVDIVLADFSKFDTVREAAKKIIKEYEKIDILVNSVGIYSTRRTFNEDGIDKVFAVNHLGTFLFTMLLLDKMKESAPSRIIQVNSEGHRFSNVRVNNINFKGRIYTGMKSYGASKTAQLYTVYEIAERLVGTGVTINAMHPGAVRSNIGQNNGWLYRFYYKYITNLFLKDPKISADAMHYLATAEELENVSGKFFNQTIEEKPARHAVKKKLQKPVWDLSIKLTGLEDKIK